MWQIGSKSIVNRKWAFSDEESFVVDQKAVLCYTIHLILDNGSDLYGVSLNLRRLIVSPKEIESIIFIMNLWRIKNL